MVCYSGMSYEILSTDVNFNLDRTIITASFKMVLKLFLVRLNVYHVFYVSVSYEILSSDYSFNFDRTILMVTLHNVVFY
jgi:hypothetical protein